MQVTLKDFKQGKWTIEIDPSETVSASANALFSTNSNSKFPQVLKLKQLNGELQGWEPSQQKLIFSGEFE